MTVVFVDLEASSLLPESFPIEIAWVFEDGTGESHLIRPADNWLDVSGDHLGWSAESEQIHGISLETLLRDGEPADVVARRAAAVLSVSKVLTFSDSPPSDGYWLQKLLDVGGIRHTASVLDIRTLYGWACSPLHRLLPPVGRVDRKHAVQLVSNLSREIVERAEEAEHVAQRVRHRALPDAMSLWRTQQAIVTAVAQYLREAGR